MYTCTNKINIYFQEEDIDDQMPALIDEDMHDISYETQG